MALLDTNMWSGNQMGPQGMPQQGVPQLPPSLAQQLMQRSMMRRNPQTNPLMAATLMPPPQLPGGFPGYPPAEIPKPTEFWNQQYQPQPDMRAIAGANAMPHEAGVGIPGQLPQPGGPQIPENMTGMGFGAMAPQMMGGAPKPAGIPGMSPEGGQPGQEDPMSKFRNQMFGEYLNLYPEGNL